MSKSRKEKISEKGRKKHGRWVTLTALEICMVAIQLALGTLCIQLSHMYSAPKLLENEWEKNSRKKKGRKAGGKGRKKLEEDKKGGEKKKCKSREKGREEMKKSYRKRTPLSPV